ncbi:MAG: S8 family serine peptidase [Actinomycetota bacterium]|nr:S8 family serine peptidase [Actinomycetota bacterium]
MVVGVALPIYGGTGVSAAPAAASYNPSNDLYSMKSLTEMIGATEFWHQGFTGAGIDVAVIDTGVAPVKGLDAAGKVVHGPDLSLESQVPALTRLDTNGHGTFMAGLIAGKDPELTWPYEEAPATAYRGIAPDARIVSLKVGTADGGVDVTQVIAAINWVVDHKNDNGLNIRVLNLSYGTNSTQSYIDDPLSHAAERAWRAGIVVVAAAGNTGYQRGASAPGLADPAYNPFVIAVGGYDTKGTREEHDDTVGSYSASANVRGARRPDFVAVGSRLQGLRVPNSFIDSQHGPGRLGDRYFRGSGTSEAAAITSGTIALLLQKYPSLTPDQVKKLMRYDTRPLVGANPAATGPGAMNLWWLAWERPQNTYPQNFIPATGRGSVERSRGKDHVSLNGVQLKGEIDIFGKPFAPGTSGSSWSGGQWNGSSWSGSSWSGSSWSGSSWSGSSWSGSSWSGSSWSGSSWSGSSWSGSSWSGCSWSGSSWSGGTWASGSWA